MARRVTILLGLALGALWALAVVILPGQAGQPFIPFNIALIYAFLPGGLVMALMVAVLAARRFFSEAAMGGAPFAPGSRGAIDQAVLTNTVEQMVLALLIWPFVATWLGALTVIVMGIAMAVARLAFWLGSHIARPLRAFGFAASFLPTVFAVLWTVGVLVF